MNSCVNDCSIGKILKQKNVYIREIKNIDKINDCTKDNPLVFTFIETKWPFVATAAISISKPYMFKITHLSVEVTRIFWFVTFTFVRKQCVCEGEKSDLGTLEHYCIFCSLYNFLWKIGWIRKWTKTYSNEQKLRKFYG